MATWEAPPAYADPEQIAAGAQSCVFRATRRRDGAVVALKAYPPGTVAARRELTALVLLAGHPHVIVLHDVTGHGGRLWIETDLCPNGTLADPVAPGAPPAQRFRAVARLLAGAAYGLAAVHASGLVHRDVKPANLLRDAGGEVRLADFGLAVPVREAVGASAVGTRRFAAPELDDGPATPASDLYALGVTLADLLHAVARDALPEPRRDRRPTTLPAPAPSWNDGLGGGLAATARILQDPDPGRRGTAAAVARRFGVLAPSRQVLLVPPART